MIPEGYAGIIKERSGFPYRGINIAVRGGVIDCGYTGEIVVLLSNSSNSIITLDGNKAVAQMVIVAIHEDVELRVSQNFFDAKVFALTEERQRGENGFGSSDQVAA
jgi:dUTPase